MRTQLRESTWFDELLLRLGLDHGAILCLRGRTAESFGPDVVLLIGPVDKGRASFIVILRKWFKVDLWVCQEHATVEANRPVRRSAAITRSLTVFGTRNAPERVSLCSPIRWQLPVSYRIGRILRRRGCRRHRYSFVMAKTSRTTRPWRIHQPRDTILQKPSTPLCDPFLMQANLLRDVP